MTRHIVLFKFKKSCSEEDLEEIDKSFRKLPSVVGEISSMEGGLNNSPENLNEGYSHGYLLTFPSEKERDRYLPHIRHREFGEMIKESIDKVLVFDYDCD